MCSRIDSSLTMKDEEFSADQINAALSLLREGVGFGVVAAQQGVDVSVLKEWMWASFERAQTSDSFDLRDKVRLLGNELAGVKASGVNLSASEELFLRFYDVHLALVANGVIKLFEWELDLTGLPRELDFIGATRMSGVIRRAQQIYRRLRDEAGGGDDWDVFEGDWAEIDRLGCHRDELCSSMIVFYRDFIRNAELG